MISGLPLLLFVCSTAHLYIFLLDGHMNGTVEKRDTNDNFNNQVLWEGTLLAVNSYNLLTNNSSIKLNLPDYSPSFD